MKTKKSSFICPYCFEENALTKIQFRCTNTRCINVGDIEMTKYNRGDITKPQPGKTCFSVNTKNSFNIPKSAICPVKECQQKTYEVVCPSCHNALPESTLTGRDMIISIVGSRDTGKSHFIGVIIHELSNRISIKFGGAMEPFDDSSERYKMTFGPLYDERQKLDLTQSSEKTADNGAYKPLIYRLKIKRKNFLGSSIESFTFVFFDTAGEDLNRIETMGTVNKYICKSAGIIFLLDPLQIPAVANQLDENIVSRASSVKREDATSSDDIISRISKLIRDDKELKENQRIDIPVAAVFSKFDVIEPIIREKAPGSTILELSPHCGKGIFDDTDQAHVDSEIKGLLKVWQADSFINQLEINYSDYSFFTVSSLGIGNNPAVDRSIKRPNPHRIEDPLLWIFKEKGIISSTKTSPIMRFIQLNRAFCMIVISLLIISASVLAIHVKSILDKPFKEFEDKTKILKEIASQVEATSVQVLSAADQVVSTSNQNVNFNRQVIRACESYLGSSNQQTRDSLARQIVTSDKQATTATDQRRSAVEQYNNILLKYDKEIYKTYADIRQQYQMEADKLIAVNKRAAVVHESTKEFRNRADNADNNILNSRKRAQEALDQVIATNKQREDCLRKIK